MTDRNIPICLSRSVVFLFSCFFIPVYAAFQRRNRSISEITRNHHPLINIRERFFHPMFSLKYHILERKVCNTSKRGCPVIVTLDLDSMPVTFTTNLAVEQVAFISELVSVFDVLTYLLLRQPNFKPVTFKVSSYSLFCLSSSVSKSLELII